MLKVLYITSLRSIVFKKNNFGFKLIFSHYVSAQKQIECTKVDQNGVNRSKWTK